MASGLLVGVMVGVILQRARFCFATAFRDLFNGPENARAINIQKGIVVAVLRGARRRSCASLTLSEANF